MMEPNNNSGASNHEPSNPARDKPAIDAGVGGAATPSEAAMPSTLDANPEPSCRLVLELLPEAVGGDLDAGTELAIARHVSSCHACGREWASLRRAHRALTSLSEGDQTVEEGSRMDDAFFAELHQDIIGEVKYRQQQDKDRRLFENACPLPEAPQPERGSVLSIRGIRTRLQGSLLHVASLAAAVLLGILIGKQFETNDEVPGTNGTGNPVIRVSGGAEGGPLRQAGDANRPSVRRIDGRVTDEEFRAWLDRWMDDLYLPQPVTPDPVILEPPAIGTKKGAPVKKGEDF